MNTPGARIELDGTLNLRDLGGWQADGGTVARGLLYRSDRLSELTDADLDRLDTLEIRTVIDLRYGQEANEHPSRLWSSVDNHVDVPMAGDLANQKSFIERAFAGEMDDISDQAVGEGYIEMLIRHAIDFGRAINIAVDNTPTLFHCTAGKDRTGLLAMLMLGTLGVGQDDILHDFTLSNQYRAEVRMKALAPIFAAEGLNVETFRPAFSAPRLAMEMALEWIGREYGSPTAYVREAAGLGDDGIDRLRNRTLVPG
ncbi:MAG: tyrosine-protein phosphatase [Actinomycetia bacterium]|nr:tyrosine-protein phosphatase [Actinomycetes bacterium]MCP4958117.1 tyrosine-protein phosphatase [Actinomycetes bacterium]